MSGLLLQTKEKDINVCKLFDMLNTLRDKREQIKKQIAQLRAIADLLEPMQNIITEILPI